MTGCLASLAMLQQTKDCQVVHYTCLNGPLPPDQSDRDWFNLTHYCNQPNNGNKCPCLQGDWLLPGDQRRSRK